MKIYFRRMKMLTSILLLLFSFCSQAQQYYIVRGTVTEQATGKPLALASVFAQNTTIGTATDSEGKFSIMLPSGGYDLVVTFTGYQTESKRITNADAGEPQNFFLKEKEKELQAVAIVTSNEVTDGLEIYGNFFKDEFLGTERSRITIQNPEVLHFFFSKKRNRLKIMADSVLMIRNEDLGYNIKYALDSFTHEYASELTTYTGYPLFEELSADSATIAAYQPARDRAYRGSLLHFMRSLYAKQLLQDKFEIQFLLSRGEKADTAIKLRDPYIATKYQRDDSTGLVEITPVISNMGVLYKAAKPSVAYLTENPAEPADFLFSQLIVRPGESIAIEPNGYFYEQNDVTQTGWFAKQKLATALPYNFVPSAE